MHWLLPLLVLAGASGDSAGKAADGLAAQVDAWNRGDLEAALAAYCDSRDIVWVNRKGVSRGFADFAAGMRADFADRAMMGRYEAEILDRRVVGPEAALITVRWSIARGGKRLMGGISTQLWQPCGGRLRIVLEHAS